MSFLFPASPVKRLGATAAGLLLLVTACGPADSADRQQPPGIGGVLRADASTPRPSSDATDSRSDTSGARPDTAPSRFDTAVKPDVSGYPPDAGTPTAACAEIPLWTPDTAYQPTDRVRHGEPPRAYECRP